MKNIIFKSCLIALCLICGLGNAWATDFTLTSAESVSKDGITITFAKGSNTSNGPAWYTAGLRLYASNTVTISSTNNITSITFNWEKQGSKTFASASASTGTYNHPSSAGEGSWTGSAKSVTFTLGGSGQLQLNTLSVTAGSSTPTARTVTFDAGSNGTCTTTSLTEASAGAGVTLPSCTPNTNYTFVGWSTSSTPSSADAGTAGENYKPSSDCTLYAYYTYQAPSHTAHFSINGTINDAYDCTVTEGSAITFPTGLADINGKKFVGWGENTISGTTDNKPTIVESATMGTSDVTYYAVYATQTGGGAPSYEKLASSSFDTNATYVLAANESANTSTIHYFSTYTTVTANESWGVTSTDPADAIIFTLSGTASALKAKDADDSYIQALATGKFRMSGSVQTLKLNDDGTISNPTSGSTGYNLRYNHNNGSGGFRWYNGTTGCSAYFYKVIGGTTYSAYCTTVTTSGPTDASWTVTPDAVSVEVGKTATATIDTNYDGTLSVVSNDTSKATVTINDKVITVTGVAAGTTTLTLTGEETSNFNAINETIDVTVTAAGTTPAFEYFEETATISIGEVLEAKDYCGTIATDAGFDDYSISTAVCSAIDATDDNKLSDDYACIYSKVSFKKAGTYVVHVTAPAVAGKYTASEGYITVTVTGPTLYKVTIETPENGTLIVKHGDDTVESGDEFAKDEKLDITVTPDEGYKFRNWQAVDNTTHTYTTTFKYIIGESDVTISANFDELATYAINFSINGNIATQNLKEGADVTVPTAEEVNAARPTGVTKVFTGWVTSEESVDANETPTYVIPATTAINNITYYAVFATKTGEGEGEGGDYKLVEEDLGTAWAGQYLIAYSDDVFANGKVSGTSGLGKAQSHVAPGDALSSDKKTVTAAWGDEYYVTLEEISDNSNTYVLKTQDNEYNYQTTNKNGLTSSENKTTAAAYPISITFNGSNDIDLALGGNATGAVFHYNNNSGTSGEMFRFYKDGGQKNIYLYKKSATTGGATYSDFTTLVSCKISISEYGATSFSVPMTYTIPEGIIGKTITLKKKVDSRGEGFYQLNYHEDFKEGDVVPAGEALVLYGEEGDYEVIYGGTTDTELKEDNLLHAVYTEQDGKFLTTYEYDNKDDYYYYKLTTKNKANFGWYFGNTTGDPFLMSRKDRAYLVISRATATSVRGFTLAEGEEDDITTGINDVETYAEGSIFNLQGIRQNTLQKGINIVNGKKVIR